MHMQKSLSSYDILNVSQQASQADIHMAYRKLAKTWHPDRHQGDKAIRANENFKMLQAAYETVKTPEARSNYNQLLARQKRALMATQGKAINDNSVVSGFFRALEALLYPTNRKGV